MRSDHLAPPLAPADARERIAICWITAIAVVCRLVALHQPMRYDESVTWAYFVGQPWSTLVSSYPFPNNHVFYSLLAKLSASIAPWSPWALRLPAFLAGVAIVPLTWAVGRRFADRATALLGAALAAASTSLIVYSTNARGYSLVAVIFLLMLLVADGIRRGSARSGWLTFTLLAALGLYTVPVMLYPMGVVALWLVMDAVQMPPHARQRRIAAVTLSSAGAVALAGLLYLPIVRSAGLSALAGNKFVSASSWPVFVQGLPKFLAELIGTWSSPLPWWSVLLVALLALLGLRRPVQSRTPSLAIATGVWCLALLLLTHRVPFIRVWLFLLPLFLLAVARGLIRVWQEGIVRRLPAIRWDAAWTSMALAVLMAAIAVRTEAAVRSADTGVFRPAREVAALLTPRLQAGDRVLAPIPSNGPLLYYFAERGLDTASLTLPLERARRAYLVLDRTHGQSLDWAVMVGMIDPAQFREPALLGRPGSAEVWMAERR